MIEFIEKEPYKQVEYIGDKEWLMYPTFMIKDNKEYFVFNRRSPQEEWCENEDKEILETLRKNDGRYTYFYTGFLKGSPYEFLEGIVKNKYSFEEFSEIIENKEYNYVDFHGNLKEISSAFHYRIYDAKIIENIKNIFDLIKCQEWTKAETEINECIKQEKKVNEADEECEI